MKRKVRLGLVGCGKRGVGVSREFARRPDCKITALMDTYPQCVENAATALNVPDAPRFTDYDAMLRDAPVDAIFFACSPMEQADLAVRAMETGRHVCTEVPAAFSLDELRKLVRAQETTGCKYQLMEQMRYAGFIETWKAMRERGEFGHICQAQGEYVHYRRNWGYWTDTETGEILESLEAPADRKVEPTWRYHILGEPIYYLPHTLSPLLRILNDRVERVSCMGTQRRSYTHPDHDLPWRDIQYALMHTAGDTIMLVGAGFSLPHVSRGPTSSHWYELRGTTASVESPRHPEGKFHVWRLGTEGYRAGEERYEEMDLGVAPLRATEDERESGHGGLDYVPVKAFIEAIRNDATPPVDARVAAELTAPAIVAAESARRGGELLSVPDFRAGEC